MGRKARLFGLAFAALALAGAMVLFPTGPAAAQSADIDYDVDNDGLIDVDSLAKLNAIRWDLNGNGYVAYGDRANYEAAFPNAAAGMGCHSIDHDRDAATDNQPVCKGYELTANLTFDSNTDNVIDSSDAAYWNNGAGWVPFIVPSAHTFDQAFETTLEGNNYTIDYLFINRPGMSLVGLFGQVDAPGRIRNLNLTNVNVTGHHYVGGLAGLNAHGIVTNVTVSGTVSGDNQVGGLVGNNACYACGGLYKHATIERSSSSGSVTGDIYVGGLVGGNNDNIMHSSSDATVKGKSRVGGLAGASAGDTDGAATIVSSHATGDVTGTSFESGGLVGYAGLGSISSSYATGAGQSRLNNIFRNMLTCRDPLTDVEAGDHGTTTQGNYSRSFR